MKPNLLGVKKTKKQSNYQKGDATERCGRCKYYHAGRCEIVEGEIDPMMVCRYFEARR